MKKQPTQKHRVSGTEPWSSATEQGKHTVVQTDPRLAAREERRAPNGDEAHTFNPKLYSIPTLVVKHAADTLRP